LEEFQRLKVNVEQRGEKNQAELSELRRMKSQLDKEIANFNQQKAEF
jgi:hypothetical protein